MLINIFVIVKHIIMLSNIFVVVKHVIILWVIINLVIVIGKKLVIQKLNYPRKVVSLIIYLTVQLWIVIILIYVDIFVELVFPITIIQWFLMIIAIYEIHPKIIEPYYGYFIFFASTISVIWIPFNPNPSKTPPNFKKNPRKKYRQYVKYKGPNDNIAWHDTQGAIKSRTMLNRIYNWAAENNPTLYTYLTKYCSQHLVAPINDTGISKSIFDQEKFNINEPVQLTPTFSKNLLRKLINLSGVYVFNRPTTNEYYVGSNLDFDSRLYGHYQIHRSNVTRLLYTHTRADGIETFLWKEVFVTKNLWVDYIRLNLNQSSDIVAYRILSDFNKYHIRLVEQAIKTYLQPSLNGIGLIIFPQQWDPSDVRKTIRGDRPFIAETTDGKTFNFVSFNEGARILGLSKKIVWKNINYNRYLDCPSVNVKARLFEINRPIRTESQINNPRHVPDAITPIDMSIIKYSQVGVFNQDYQLLGIYKNGSEAAKAYAVSKTVVKNRINKSFVTTSVLGKPVQYFFARNEFTQGNPVVLTNLKTGQVLEYSTVKDCCTDLGLAAASSSFVNRFVKGDELYRGIFKICYSPDYQGPKPTKWIKSDILNFHTPSKTSKLKDILVIIIIFNIFNNFYILSSNYIYIYSYFHNFEIVIHSHLLIFHTFLA